MSITVYSQPDCLACKRVIKKLEEAGADVEIVDISNCIRLPEDHDYVYEGDE